MCAFHTLVTSDRSLTKNVRNKLANKVTRKCTFRVQINEVYEVYCPVALILSDRYRWILSSWCLRIDTVEEIPPDTIEEIDSNIFNTFVELPIERQTWDPFLNVVSRPCIDIVYYTSCWCLVTRCDRRCVKEVAESSKIWVFRTTEFHPGQMPSKHVAYPLQKLVCWFYTVEQDFRRLLRAILNFSN